MRTAARSWSVLLAIVALSAVPARPAGAAPTPALAWRAWDPGLEEARVSGRPVLVNVYTDWCGWCRRMKADVYSRAEIRRYLDSHFVTVTLNAEGADPARYEGRSYTSRSLAARFGVKSYPTTIFLRPDGAHLVNVPGYVESADFMKVLRFIGDGHMERGVSFKEFSERPGSGGAVQP